MGCGQSRESAHSDPESPTSDIQNTSPFNFDTRVRVNKVGTGNGTCLNSLNPKDNRVPGLFRLDSRTSVTRLVPAVALIR